MSNDNHYMKMWQNLSPLAYLEHLFCLNIIKAVCGDGSIKLYHITHGGISFNSNLLRHLECCHGNHSVSRHYRHRYQDGRLQTYRLGAHGIA